MNANAVSDASALLTSLSRWHPRLYESDIHLVAYLACLLSLYRGWTPTQWGYAFASTADGSPFSGELSDAIGVLAGMRLVRREGNRLAVVDEDTLNNHARSIPGHRPFIDTAFRTTLTWPIGALRSRLQREPTLANARRVGLSRPLLTGPAYGMLEGHLAGLRQASPNSELGLFSAANVWLVYLGDEESDVITHPEYS